MLQFDTFYLCPKFDNSSLNHSRDIIGGPKFNVGHVTMTTPLKGYLSSVSWYLT